MGWRADVRLALRSLRSAPVHAVVTVATLALAIGGVVAVFTLVDPMLFRPLPYPDADRVVRSNTVGGGTFGFFQYADYFGAADARVFEHIAGFYGPTVIGRMNEDDDVLMGYSITDGLLDVLGVMPAIGRPFTREEYAAAVPRPVGQGYAARVVLITDGLWTRSFGRRPDVLGRSLTLTSSGVARSLEIVGVLPRGFVFPDLANEAPSLLLPGAIDRARAGDLRGLTDLFGRLRPGQSIDQATAALQRVVADTEREYPSFPQHRQVRLRTVRESLFGPVRSTLLMLLGVTLCVLVLASANLAHLNLGRAGGRLREIAVRQALGASAWQIIRLLVTEATMLAVLGGALAVALGRVLFALVMTVLPRFSHVYRLMDAQVDLRVVAAAVILTGGSLVVFGVLPALSVVRSDLRSTLQSASGRTRGGHRRGDAALTTLQTSVAVSVLVTAALLIGSFLKMTESVNGITLTGLAGVSFDLPRDAYPTPDRTHLVNREFVNRLAAAVGAPVGIARGIPGMTLPGGLWRSTDAPDAKLQVIAYPADRTFVDLVGVELLRGRLYSNEEAQSNAPVAVIDERTANAFWPGEDPLGRTVRDRQSPTSPIRTVIGLLRTVNAVPSRDETRNGTAFVPLDPNGRSADSIVFRGLVTTQFVDGARRIAREIEPRAPVRVSAITIGDHVMGQPRLLARLFGTLGGLALLLTIAGVYAVVSRGVAGRTAEIGVRMALGATATTVRRLVVWETQRPALFGVTIGLALSLWWTRALRGLLFELQPYDPLMFSVAGGAVIAVVALASVIPARRASRVDPVVALRAD